MYVPRAFLRSLIYRVSPQWYRFLESLWLYNSRLRHEHLIRQLVARHGLVVQSGPFAGMVYVPHAVCSALMPKLLGSYEEEIRDSMMRLLDDSRPYENVVDIGCAEGYYAVGLALRLTDIRVYAFDTDALAQQWCRDLARANGVSDRVIVAGECDLEQLRTLTQKRSLVICDCEGCELDLLQPEFVPGLRTADIVVELHDFIEPSISRTIQSRFADSHDIALISSVERSAVDYPMLHHLDDKDQRLALAEFRPETMQWALMTSRSGR